MKTVIGELNYQVYVKCPECELPIDLVDQDSYQDYSLAICVFGNNDGQKNWDNIGLTFICPECDTEFELEKIEY